MQARYDVSPPPSPAPARVLVVDDEPANVRLMRAYLVAEGFDVRTATSGPEALQRVAEGVDLVLLDIRMPGMDGLEVCRRIRSDPSRAQLPIIFVTAELNDQSSELAGLQAGADEYLHKPVPRLALLARVRSLLRLADAERARRLSAQLAQSEKLAAIGQIAAGVAHEINNPLSFMLSNLTTLTGYLEDVGKVIEAWRNDPAQARALEQSLDFDRTLEDVGSLIQETLEGGQRVRAIVHGLKSFSRTDEAPLEPVDLAEVAASTLLLTERELSSRARLSKELEPAKLPAASRNALQQVVLNLLVNAMHALKGRGDGECRIRIASGTRDGTAWLSVSDTGCGIPAALRDRIFEPFFTTKPIGEGTGMGLSFCANVVSRLGGRIDVESEEGVGTTFTLRVPVAN